MIEYVKKKKKLRIFTTDLSNIEVKLLWKRHT